MNDLLKYNADSAKVYRYLEITFNPTAIVPLFYEGAIAGSEFLTYAATKLYMCVHLAVNVTAPNVVIYPSITFYNEANAIFSGLINAAIMYNAGTAVINYIPNSANKENFYFSRLTAANYSQLTFNGYRFTLP